jgi:hypothetical protein
MSFNQIKNILKEINSFKLISQSKIMSYISVSSIISGIFLFVLELIAIQIAKVKVNEIISIAVFVFLVFGYISIPFRSIRIWKDFFKLVIPLLLIFASGFFADYYINGLLYDNPFNPILDLVFVLDLFVFILSNLIYFHFVQKSFNPQNSSTVNDLTPSDKKESLLNFCTALFGMLAAFISVILLLVNQK